MELSSKSDSSIIMIGEFVFDDQLVIRDVQLRKNKYGNYYLHFPEFDGKRPVYPIKSEFYSFLLSESLIAYQRKRSILGRKANEKKGCEVV